MIARCHQAMDSSDKSALVLKLGCKGVCESSVGFS
jgi:hypothetical protein